jgi:hypothetical protein
LPEVDGAASTETVRRRHMPVKPRAHPMASRGEGRGGGMGGRKWRRMEDGEAGAVGWREERARFMVHLKRNECSQREREEFKR